MYPQMIPDTGEQQKTLTETELQQMSISLALRGFYNVLTEARELTDGAWGRTRTGMRYCLEGF